MGINSICVNNATSAPMDVGMTSTVVGIKMEPTSCPSNDTSCTPSSSLNCASTNEPIGIGFAGEQIGDLKNGVTTVTVMEAEGQEEEGNEAEIELKEGDEEGTVFPHEPGTRKFRRGRHSSSKHFDL